MRLTQMKLRFSLALVALLVGSMATAQSESGESKNVSPEGVSAPVIDKPVKPRIRRDSKIIANEPRVVLETVDGSQTSINVSELRAHLTRMAQLEYIGQLASQNDDVDMGARVNELLRLERKRYKNAVKRLKAYTRLKTQVGVP